MCSTLSPFATARPASTASSFVGYKPLSALWPSSSFVQSPSFGTVCTAPRAMAPPSPRPRVDVTQLPTSDAFASGFLPVQGRRTPVLRRAALAFGKGLRLAPGAEAGVLATQHGRQPRGPALAV